MKMCISEYQQISGKDISSTHIRLKADNLITDNECFDRLLGPEVLEAEGLKAVSRF